MSSRILRSLIVAALTLGFLLVAALIILPAASPATGAAVADWLRALVGVQRVSQLESISDRLRDDINRYRFASGTAQPQISWAGTSQPGTGGTIATAMPKPTAQPEVAAVVPTSIPQAKPGMPIPATDVVTADPQIGWQAYGPSPGGVPLLARALIMVDPQRSYAGVALVRIDLSKTQLHIMPGIIEPAHPSGIGQLIPSLGTVPPADQGALIAAFNGGFKAAHGHYGMMVNGMTLLPAVDGMATIAVYQDGSVRIGAWNQDISASPDMVAYRQNCPPLIDAGQLNPALDTESNKAWGFTNNSDITWRTAVGISQDGRYLIYAVGNGTDVKFLAAALQQAGAYAAMQLDINQYYAQFVTYTQSGNGPVEDYLLDQMTRHAHEFLVPNVRDFFYVTAR